NDADHLLKQINNNIKKKIDYIQYELENEPYGYLTGLCCLDHISELMNTSTTMMNQNEDGDENENVDDNRRFTKWFLNKKYLNKLYNKPIDYWHNLIKTYLIEWDNNRRTAILLKPSTELLHQIQG
ncbi:unnamed protein product, partial [Didymodactylos carnosus]